MPETRAHHRRHVGSDLLGQILDHAAKNTLNETHPASTELLADESPVHVPIRPGRYTCVLQLPKRLLDALQPTTVQSTSTSSDLSKSWMVEEIIMYFFLFLLIVFLFFHLIRCVRATLDPYRSVARAAWFETLNKARLESFP